MFYYKIVIYRNNIYIFFRVDDNPIQLTYDGREGLLFNGIPDLMYEGKSPFMRYFN